MPRCRRKNGRGNPKPAKLHGFKQCSIDALDDEDRPFAQHEFDKLEERYRIEPGSTIVTATQRLASIGQSEQDSSRALYGVTAFLQSKDQDIVKILRDPTLLERINRSNCRYHTHSPEERRQRAITRIEGRLGCKLDDIFEKWHFDAITDLPAVTLTGIENIIRYLSDCSGPDIRQILNNGLNGPPEDRTERRDNVLCGAKPTKTNLANLLKDLITSRQTSSDISPVSPLSRNGDTAKTPTPPDPLFLSDPADSPTAIQPPRNLLPSPSRPASPATPSPSNTVSAPQRFAPQNGNTGTEQSPPPLIHSARGSVTLAPGSLSGIHSSPNSLGDQSSIDCSGHERHDGQYKQNQSRKRKRRHAISSPASPSVEIGRNARSSLDNFASSNSFGDDFGNTFEDSFAPGYDSDADASLSDLRSPGSHLDEGASGLHVRRSLGLRPRLYGRDLPDLETIYSESTGSCIGGLLLPASQGQPRQSCLGEGSSVNVGNIHHPEMTNANVNETPNRPMILTSLQVALEGAQQLFTRAQEDVYAAKTLIQERQDALVRKKGSYEAARSAEAPSLENVNLENIDQLCEKIQRDTVAHARSEEERIAYEVSVKERDAALGACVEAIRARTWAQDGVKKINDAMIFFDDGKD